VVNRVPCSPLFGSLAADVDGDLLGQVAVGHGGRHLGDVPHLAREVRRHRVHVVGEVLPGAGDALYLGLAAEAALGADLPGDAGDLVGEGAQLVDHRVDRVLELENLALDVHGDLLGQVPIRHGRRDLGDVPDLAGEIGRHRVDVVRERLPRPGDAGHLGLPAELALGADLARDARHLVGERAELVDHRVHRRLQLEDLAPRVTAALPGRVAAGHVRRA